MNILIAEDDESSRLILEATLEAMGHKVVSAPDGREAWRKVLIDPPDVIVSDWMMPDMDGIELCKRVRKQRSKNYIYFIVLTARSQRDNYLEAMQAGVDDFFSKPLKPDELAIRLQVASRILKFVKQLSDLKRLLPICSYCRKVRNDQQFWEDIEVYIQANTMTDFSHGVCPQCYESHLKPQIDQMESEPRNPPSEENR